MARIRSIKPEFWSDEKLAPLRPIDRLVFLGLISQADDAGRLVDNLRLIDGLLFPETEESSRESLEILASVERIVRYVSGSGQSLIQVTNWQRHQRVEHPSSYVLPGPEDPGSSTVSTPESLTRVSGDSHASILDLDLGSTINDQDLRSKSLVRENADGGALDATSTVKVLHEHFCQKRGGRHLKLTADRAAKYRARLRTFKPDEIIRAIDSALEDPFYRGENDRSTRYDYPETILKNDAAVDRHLDRASNGRPGGREDFLRKAERVRRALD